MKTRIDDAMRRRPSRFHAPVRLVAVSKRKTIADIAAAIEAGVGALGENYVQEAVPKIEALLLPAQAHGVDWHLIGPLQSNKARLAAQHFDWVQSVDRAKIADALDRHRAEMARPLDVLIQVNPSGEPAKSGVPPEQALALAHHVATKPHLRLRGLMAIVENTRDDLALRMQFRIVRALFEELSADREGVDTLSMGMSGDFDIAIEEGATMVRIGSAIFGERS